MTIPEKLLLFIISHFYISIKYCLVLNKQQICGNTSPYQPKAIIQNSVFIRQQAVCYNTFAKKEAYFMKLYRHIKSRMLDYIHQKKGLHPNFPTEKILFILLLYSASFSLFLAGVKHIQMEQAAAKFKNMQADRRMDVSASMKSRAANQQQATPALQNHLAENILRLHVVADSDAPRDQALKLKVRDRVISYLRETIRNATSPAQAEELITPQIPALTAIARETLTQNGNQSPVRISIENREFPVKTYGDLTFPAGTYRSLCIDIGTAQGQNWWCVLFPSLCFVDETTATVPQKSKERLKEGLTAEEYQALEQPKNQIKPTNPPQKDETCPEVHSAFLDWF